MQKFRSKAFNSAFSLVEISVVILIIGILVAGIYQASDLISSARLSSAKSLTNTAIINRIPNLVFWVETTEDSNLKSSLVTNINSAPFGQIANNARISTWRDRNPQNLNKISTFASSDNRRPTYITNGINSLPALYFDASLTQTLYSPTMPLQASDADYTLIAVFERDPCSGYCYVVAQTSGATGSMAAISANAGGTFGFVTINNDLSSGITIRNKRQYIGIITVGESNVAFYLNSKVPVIRTKQAGLNLGSGSFSIASRSNGLNNFWGLISEIIIFDRDLKDSEVQDAISYLAKKYSIKTD